MHNTTTLLMNFSLNESIPHCPTHTPAPLLDIGFPTSTIIFVVFAVTSLVFAVIIAFKYNSVKVFNRKIRTQNISNTMWIIYYLTVGLRACISAVMYGFKVQQASKHVHDMLFIASLILGAVNAFSLCLSLNHQKRYRSSAPPNPAPQGGSGAAKEAEPLLGKNDLMTSFVKTISIAEVLFFALFVVNLAFLLVALKLETRSVFVIVFVGTYVLQRLPVVVLSMIIVGHRNGNEGPTRQSKVYLFFAALFHLSSELPIFFWAQLLPTTCLPLLEISWIDLLTILNFISLLLFFLFLRSEYLRNMEECIWTTVSQIQDTFDFRRF